MTWANKYIGDPWIAGEHDCWAFARRVWLERYGWHVPPVDVDALNNLAAVRAFNAHPERVNWQRIADPVEGAAVLMGKSDRPSHVGIWLDASPSPGILHCMRGAGVVFSTPQALAASGYRVLGYYRRAV